MKQTWTGGGGFIYTRNNRQENSAEKAAKEARV